MTSTTAKIPVWASGPEPADTRAVSRSVAVEYAQAGVPVWHRAGRGHRVESWVCRLDGDILQNLAAIRAPVETREAEELERLRELVAFVLARPALLATVRAAVHGDEPARVLVPILTAIAAELRRGEAETLPEFCARCEAFRRRWSGGAALTFDPFEFEAELAKHAATWRTSAAPRGCA